MVIPSRGTGRRGGGMIGDSVFSQWGSLDGAGRTLQTEKHRLSPDLEQAQGVTSCSLVPEML